jgi:hypothetical protein
VRDLGSVISDLNARFDTDFQPFRHRDDDVAAVYAVIEDRARRPPWLRELGRFQAGLIDQATYRRSVAAGQDVAAASIPERRIPRPSAERTALKERLRTSLDDTGLTVLRARARRAYERFVGPPA